MSILYKQEKTANKRQSSAWGVKNLTVRNYQDTKWYKRPQHKRNA